MLAALTVLLFVAPPARAQSTQDAFQLGLGTTIVSYTNAELEVELPAWTQTLEVSETQWGLSGDNGVSLELGFGIGESLVVGGVLVFGGATETSSSNVMDDDETTDSSLSILVGPKLDFMFLPDSNVRPLLGAAIAWQRSSAETETTTAQSVTTTLSDVALSGVQLMTRAGLRWFVVPAFSLDPAVVFQWTTVSGDYGVAAQNFDASASGLSIGLGLSVSGWIGP